MEPTDSSSRPSFPIGATLGSILRAVRYSQPFNWLATHATRRLFGGAGPGGIFHKYLHHVGTTTVTLPNGRQMKMFARADDGVSNDLFWGGWCGYEPEVTKIFFRLAEQSPVTLDVGAHVGFYAILAALANPAGRVVAFEPMTAIMTRLRENVARNALGNVECVPQVVSDEESDVEFFFCEDSPLPSSSSASRAFMSGVANVTSRRIPSVTLDDYCLRNDLRSVCLVKIDTESTEPQVLAGMSRLVERDRPFIFCEVLPGQGVEAKLDAYLAEHRYLAYHLTDGGPVQRNNVTGDWRWKNYLFVPREREAGAFL